MNQWIKWNKNTNLVLFEKKRKKRRVVYCYVRSQIDNAVLNWFVSLFVCVSFCVCVDKNSGIENEADIENLVSERKKTVGDFVFPAISTCVLNWLIALNVEHKEIKVMFQVLVGSCFCHCIPYSSMCWTRAARFCRFWN